MTTVINTNLASLFAQNSLSNAQNNLATSVQRLSSGLRINSAKDDAAGLAIAQNMQSQINGTNQSIQNLNDATNLLQTADSSLSTIQDMLLRLKQLSTQGYDGSLSTTQKADIVQQMKDLNSEINATASRTSFNGINLLTSGSSIDQVNSDVKAGSTLSNVAVAVKNTVAGTDGLGVYAVGGGAGANANLGDTVAAGGVNSTFTINLDPSKQAYTPGTYTLSNVGANLTLTGTFKGQSMSQTVTVAQADGNSAGGAANPINQTLNFDNFGISIDLTSHVASGYSETGDVLATAIVNKGLNGAGTASTIQVAGQGSAISDVRLSGAAPGTYTLSYGATGSIADLGLPKSIAGQVTANAAGVLKNVQLNGGSGTGAYGDVAYDASGNITGISLRTAGTGYKAGDVLSVAVLNADASAGLANSVVAPTSTYSAGAGAVTATSTVDTLHFGAQGLADGQSISINGRTFTASGGSVTTAALVTAIAADAHTAGDNIVVGGAYSNTPVSKVASGGNQIVLTQALGANAHLTLPSGGTGGNGLINSSGIITSVDSGATGLATASASASVTTVTFASGMTAGDTMTIGGQTLTATQDMTATQVRTSWLSGAITGYGSFNGSTFTHATTVGAGNGTTTLTFTDASSVGSDVPLGSISVVDNNKNKAHSALSGIVVKDLSVTGGNHLLTLSGSVNGTATTQTVDLANGANGFWNTANNSKTIDFSSFGVAFDVNSFQNVTGDNIGQALAALNPGSKDYGLTSTGTPGQIIVGQGNNSRLDFQSGAASSAFISIDTLNVQTGTTGATAGSSGAMMTVGTDITGVGAAGAVAAGTLGTLGANDTISAWQTAFKNTSAAIDAAIDYVSTARSTYGSQMNRLGYISSNLTAQTTNLQNSRSAITDTNFASETAALTKGQIMQQAATAMLAQANQMPNVILSLLK